MVRTLAFHPDGEILASGSQDGLIILSDVTTGQPLQPPLEGHSDALWVLAFSPDGEILASGSQDKTIILWDVKTGQPLGPPLEDHTGPVRALAFSADGRILASGSESGGESEAIILWDVATRLPLGDPLIGHKAGISALVFSPDTPQTKGGQILASAGGDEGIMLWDVNTRQLVGPPLTGHSGSVLTLDFSADGRVLASGGQDRTVRLWDVTTRQPIAQPLLGHTGTIWNALFSPKSAGSAGGEILASSSEDGTIILWDLATYRPLGQPLQTNDMIWSLAYRPVTVGNKDDPVDLLASGNSVGKISLWDVGPESWQSRVCQMVRRNLTRTEWERYLGDEPYQPTCPSAPLPAEDEGRLSASPQSESFPAADDHFSDVSPGPISAAIVEEFESDQGFIQTSPDVYISEGQVFWHYKRNGGMQYVYRSITPFAGDVRLVVRGQVDSWTSNCTIRVGVGDGLGDGAGVSIGYTGGGCETNGPLLDAYGVSLLDRQAGNCEYTGNWLWVEGGRSYTTTLELRDEVATLAVDGVGISAGEVTYEGPYTTLYVGNQGNGDWPECEGKIDSIRVEPLR
jgi:WD40 repeat protein